MRSLQTTASSLSVPPPRRARAAIKLGLPQTRSAFAHDDIVPACVDFEFFQGTRWRTGDVFSVQVVLSVVAGAPNQFYVGAVLNYAFEVRANSRKSFQLTGRRANNYAWLVAKLKNLS